MILSGFVKIEDKILLMKCQEVGLNHRPWAYESHALAN